MPDPGVLAIVITHLREKLGRHGITIDNDCGCGWSISPASKAKVNEMTRAERECAG
jgi:hypothetical protein